MNWLKCGRAGSVAAFVLSCAKISWNDALAALHLYIHLPTECKKWAEVSRGWMWGINTAASPSALLLAWTVADGKARLFSTLYLLLPHTHTCSIWIYYLASKFKLTSLCFPRRWLTSSLSLTLHLERSPLSLEHGCFYSVIACDAARQYVVWLGVYFHMPLSSSSLISLVAMVMKLTLLPIVEVIRWIMETHQPITDTGVNRCISIRPKEAHVRQTHRETCTKHLLLL